MKYNTVILGSGIGGYPAAIYLADRGLRVAVVEEHLVGGECTNYGCVPSKALYQFAESVKNIDKINGSASYKWSDLVNWVRDVVRESREGVEYLLNSRGVEVVYGRGFFRSQRRILVETTGGMRELEADSVLIATGTDPVDIPSVKFDKQLVISNREVFSLEEKPGSLLIIGGGVIGVELANIFSSLGVGVTIVELLEHILPFTDRDIATALRTHLVQRGVHVSEKTTVKKLEKTGSRLSVELSNGEKIEVDRVIVAAGRAPKTENIGLEEIGVLVDSKGFIKVNERLETGIPGIYASGDVVGGPLLAHKALLESIAVAKRIANEESFTLDYRSVPITIFTGLEIASIGYTEKELQSMGIKYVKYKIPLYFLSSVKIKGYKNSFAKIILDEKGEKILGIHIVSPSASEVISSYIPLYLGRLSLNETRRIPYPHLTVSESLRDFAEYILGEPVHLSIRK